MHAKSYATQDQRHANPSICGMVSTSSHWPTYVSQANLPREMTLPSAHHSPITVNKKASEFVIGTVNDNSVTLSALSKLSSSKLDDCHLTSLPDQQKEPNTPSNIKQKRYRVGRILEQVYHSVQNSPSLAFHPGRI